MSFDVKSLTMARPSVEISKYLKAMVNCFQ
jgi:hypothetical protein